MYDFRNRVVLLTGATGGLGQEFARLLAAEGARLILSARNGDRLQKMVETLPNPENVVAIGGTLSEVGKGPKLAKAALEAHGRVDVLINNAGMGYFAMMEEVNEDRIREIFELNTFTPLLLMRELVPQMAQRGDGLVINITSAAGRVPIPTVGIYGGSKSALAIMANTMRFELEPTGVRILNVYPGTASTAFEVNALREKNRDGLYGQSGYEGRPVESIVKRILTAARTENGEVWLERECKWMSAGSLIVPGYIERKLRPFRDRARAYGKHGKPHGERRWQLWQVETAICCNLDCVMCPWQDIREQAGDQGLMSDEVWEAIVPHLPEIASIDFTGGGEPLMHPDLANRIARAKKAGCRAGFLTNGQLLDEPLCEEILAADPDWISFSVDGAAVETYEKIRRDASFELLIENIQRLSDQRVGDRPRLGVNFVLMRENVDELMDLVELAARLGINKLNIKQCDVVRGDHGKDRGMFGAELDDELKRAQKAVDAAKKAAEKLGMEFQMAAFVPDEQPVCDQDPRTSLFVRQDGQVAPCINQAYGGPVTFLGKEAVMPDVHYGRFPDQDVMSVWDGAGCRHYRETFAQRMAIYNQRLMTRGLGSSLDEMKQAFEEARKAMPPPPAGCEHCSYLYGL